MIRPRIPVIPSAARNLKSITARPDSQRRASIVTKSENSVRTPYVSFMSGQTLQILRLRSAPLRMTEPGCFLVNGEWSDRQIHTPVSPSWVRVRVMVSVNRNIETMLNH